jgi:hypothetical protein
MDNHNKAVSEFLQSCRLADPERYTKICQTYPTLSGRQWKSIREHELPYTASEIEDLYASDTKLDQEE